MNKELHKETDKRIKGPALSTSFESVTSDSLYINAYGAKRLRRPNFKQEELETLVTLLEERPELASGKIGGLYCNADAQRLAWQEVAALVSGVGEAERTGREIREKWIDFKSRVKQKYRKIKDVEDGIAEEGIAIPLTPLEVRILDMVNATSNSQSQNSPSEVTRVVEYHPPGKIKDDRITKPFTLIESSGSGKSSTAHGAKRKKSGPRITTIEVGRTMIPRECEIVPTCSKQSRNPDDGSLVTITPVEVQQQHSARTSSTTVASDRQASMTLNGDDGMSDTSSCAIIDSDLGAGSVTDTIGSSITDRLLAHLAHKQDRMIDLLTELTEETYRRRTIEEETQGLLRTLVALQARRVELQEMRMGISNQK